MEIYKRDKRVHKINVKAQNVANEIIKKLSNGEKINKVEIAVRNGYSRSSAVAHKPYKTQTYKAITEQVVNQMEKVRAKSIRALLDKNHNEFTPYDLTNISKVFTHDIQLLQGKSTDNVATTPNVVVYGSEDFLALQLKRQEQLAPPQNNGSVEPQNE